MRQRGSMGNGEKGEVEVVGKGVVVVESGAVVTGVVVVGREVVVEGEWSVGRLEEGILLLIESDAEEVEGEREARSMEGWPSLLPLCLDEGEMVREAEEVAGVRDGRRREAWPNLLF